MKGEKRESTMKGEKGEHDEGGEKGMEAKEARVAGVQECSIMDIDLAVGGLLSCQDPTTRSGRSHHLVGGPAPVLIGRVVDRRPVQWVCPSASLPLRLGPHPLHFTSEELLHNLHNLQMDSTTFCRT